MRVPEVQHDTEAAASGRRWTYRGVIAIVIFIGLAVMGWQWRSGVTVSSVEVRTSCETTWFESSPGCAAILEDSTRLAEMVAVEIGEELYDVHPREIVDRVGAHPWVRSADVMRTPAGKVIVEITPRDARLLAMRNGSPSYFIDAEGNKMPFVAGVAYDVPLVYGLDETLRDAGPVKDQRVRLLAALMENLEPEIDALLSEVDVSHRNRVVIHTTPFGEVPSIEVHVDA
ncbi:MAG: hypothetical protein R3282_10135, partial [Rhodothermales bacterium]|nr:hypothetical protein [Rhodothermales bacterium]